MPKKLTILLTESNDTLRDVAARYLSRQGYQVCTARNGETALAILASF